MDNTAENQNNEGIFYLMDDKRLDRIESKLDRVTEAVTRLAVVDERLAHVITQNVKISERVRALEQLPERVTIIERFNSNAAKVIWILAAGVVGQFLIPFFGG